MNSFFGKLKQGASEAGKRAQVTVEVNRLKMQISSKEKEIANIYNRMGESTYQALQSGDLNSVKDELMEYVELINHKKEEVAEIDEKIRVLRNEKLCPSCNKAQPMETKFCSSCGHKFEEPSESQDDEDEVTEVKAACPDCEAELEPGSSFCGECGHKIEE